MRIKSVPIRNAAAAIDAISNDSDSVSADANDRLLPIDLLPENIENVESANVELDSASVSEQEDAQTECDAAADGDRHTQVNMPPVAPGAPASGQSVVVEPGNVVELPEEDDDDAEEPGYTHNPISLFLPHSPLPPESKKRKHKPGEKALREIKKYQKSTETLMPKAAVYNLVREIGDKMYPDVRFQDKAIDAFHQAAESYMQEIFEDAQLCAIHAGRVTIGVNDVLLANRIKNSGKR